MKDIVIWITGASDGIGAALVAEAAKQGARLVLSARSEEKLRLVVEKNQLQEANFLLLPFDMEKIGDANVLTSCILAKFSRIDIVFLNAGISQKGLAENTMSEVERSIMEVNFFGNICLTKAILPVMKRQMSGTIAVTSSIIAKFGAPYLSTYSASKAALNNFFESLRYEVEQYNIRILIATPGFIRTDIAKKSVTEDGSLYNQESQAQAKGMLPQKVAQKLLEAALLNKKNVYIGGIEVFMPRFKFFFPNVFHWILKKLHKM